MIYDIHTHFWKPEEVDVMSLTKGKAIGIAPRFSFTSETHLEETKAAVRSVVFGLRGKGFNISNDSVKAQVEKAPDRLVFFTSVNPAEKGFIEELERTHKDLGAKGIKLGPIYQGVHPKDKKYYEIYSYAEKHSLPIIIHMAATFSGDFPIEYAKPMYMDDVAIDFPELKLVLAHMGHPWSSETIAIIRRHPNVYADISALYYRPWQFYNTMILLTEYGAQEKVFFGSDFPFTVPAESVAGVRNVNKVVKNSDLPTVPEEIIENILNRDSFKILGIE